MIPAATHEQPMPTGDGYLDTTGNALYNALITAKAAHAARAGLWSKAESCLAPLLDAPDPPIEAMDLMAKIYAQQHFHKEAGALWSRLTERCPNNPDFAAALERCRRGNWETLRGYMMKWSPALAVSFAATALAMHFAPMSMKYMESSKAIIAIALGNAGDGWKTAAPAEPPAPDGRPAVPGGGASEPGPEPEPEAEAKPAEKPETEPSFPIAERPPENEPETPAAQPPAADHGLVRKAAGALASDPALAQYPLGIRQVNGRLEVRGELPTRHLANAALERLLAGVTGAAVDMSAVVISESYTAKPGDSLWTVAKALYGDPYVYAKIAKANGLPIDHELKVGEILALPDFGSSTP